AKIAAQITAARSAITEADGLLAEATSVAEQRTAKADEDGAEAEGSTGATGTDEKHNADADTVTALKPATQADSSKYAATAGHAPAGGCCPEPRRPPPGASRPTSVRSGRPVKVEPRKSPPRSSAPAIRHHPGATRDEAH